MQTSGSAIGVISIITVGTISEFATIAKFAIVDTKVAQNNLCMLATMVHL
jgi:hypothetical protein